MSNALESTKNYKPPSTKELRLKGYTLEQAKRQREHLINQNARIRSTLQDAEDKKNAPLTHASRHLEKETERGEHSPKIAGHDTSSHGGQIERPYANPSMNIGQHNFDRITASFKKYPAEKPRNK